MYLVFDEFFSAIHDPIEPILVADSDVTRLKPLVWGEAICRCSDVVEITLSERVWLRRS